MTRYAKVCGGELNGKTIKVSTTGFTDCDGKAVWKDGNGKHYEMEVTKHFNKTNYYIHEIKFELNK